MPDPDLMSVLDPESVVHPQTGRPLPFEPETDIRRIPTPETDDVPTLLRALIDVQRVAGGDLHDIYHAQATNLRTWQVIVVTVATAGTPVQGPNLPIPPGFQVAVIQRRHTGSHTGYVAPSNPEVRDATSRVELSDSSHITLRVDNMNEIWFNAAEVPTGGLMFELMVERERR